MPPPTRSEPQLAASGDPAATAARDAAWVAAAWHGDRQAFERLVTAYGPLVSRVIGRLVRDPDARDDLIQETFYRVCKGFARFRPGAAFRPWVLTIALNAARDHLRARQRWNTVSLDDPEQGCIPGGTLTSRTAGPAELAEARQLGARIDAAYEQLDEPARVILWLRVGEELSYEEIAAVLGIARGTVMSRLSRARQALREHLAVAVTAAGGARPERSRSGGEHGS